MWLQLDHRGGVDAVGCSAPEWTSAGSVMRLQVLCKSLADVTHADLPLAPICLRRSGGAVLLSVLPSIRGTHM